MKKFLYAIAIVLLTIGIGSCKKDGIAESKAVLTSASQLTFEAVDADVQLIEVIADGKWHVENVPSWMTVTPSEGFGYTEDVEIAVTDNIRDGAIDNNRKATIVFKGSILMSEAPVQVFQDGDKYRDIPNSTISAVEAMEDEAVVIIPEATVAAVTTDGHILTDGKAFIHVVDNVTAPAGSVVSLMGDKTSEAGYAAIINPDEMKVISAGEYTFPADAQDITKEIDTYKSDVRSPVVLCGMLESSGKFTTGSYNEEGKYVPGEAKLSINFLAVPAGVLDGLKNHVLKVQAVFAGIDAPVVNMHVVAVEDLGVAFALDLVLYYDDFNVQPNNTPDLADGYTKDMQGAGVAKTTYTAGALVDFRTSYTQSDPNNGSYENPLWPGHAGVYERTGSKSAHLYPCTTDASRQASESWFQINNINLCESTFIQIGMAIMNPSPAVTNQYHFLYKFNTDSEWKSYADFAAKGTKWEWITLKILDVPAGATSVSFRGETAYANHMRIDDITLIGDGVDPESPDPGPDPEPGNGPKATAEEVTSSTACFSWSTEDGIAADKAKPWTIQCSTSSKFNGATEYTIPANCDAWTESFIKFCFGGLVADTKYYFRVKSGDGDWSNVVNTTTLEFDKTVVGENAKAGDVILAEDFAALAIHGERVAGAVGVDEKGTGYKATWSSYTIANADKNELPEALKNWGFARGTGSANLYANQGYFKLGTGGAQGYLVSPELNAIPAGRKAKLEVAVTLSAYPDDKARVTKFFVSSQTGSMSATNMFTPAKTSNKVEGDLASDADDRIKWVTYTATLEDVMHGERLMVGAANDAGNNRIQVSDVKARIVALEDAGEPEPEPAVAPVAAATEVSSSTVSFTWGFEGATAAQDVDHNYEFGLYKDAACTNLVVSHRVAAKHACWESRKPKFCFGGLQPNTTYYFKVKDADAGKESEVVSAKTSAFTNVTMPSSAAVGDVILAEDFGELILGGEFPIYAASACTKKDAGEVFKTLNGEFPACYFAASGEEAGLTGDAYDAAKSGKRLEKWSYAFNSGSSVYSHVGCIKLGTGSNNTWLTTPVLSAIPDGKTADLEITVTLSAYDASAVATGFVYAGNIADKASIADATNVIKSSEIATTVREWKTYTVTLSGVNNTMRLAIGPDNDTAKTAKGKGRMFINDVVVKITDLK